MRTMKLGEQKWKLRVNREARNVGEKGHGRMKDGFLCRGVVRMEVLRGKHASGDGDNISSMPLA